MWCYIIHWNEERKSPPIGPFENHTEMEIEIKLVRKALRHKKRYRQGMIESSVMYQPGTPFGWINFQ